MERKGAQAGWRVKDEMSLEADNPFWQYSLRVYGAPGVAEECLDVQDKLGVDINVLLYAVWLGATRRVVLDDADLTRIHATVAAWSVDVVEPLRAVRRKMKLMPQISDSGVQALRKRVANAELFSEQIEQALLYQLAGEIGRPTAEPVMAARKNVSALLASCGAHAGAFPVTRLLAAAGV